MPVTAPQELPAQFTVAALVDPVVEAHGFPPRSDYIEACWLGILGPSACFAYRRIGSFVMARPSGAVVDLDDLAKSLGISGGRGRHSVLTRTLGRLVLFDVAAWAGADQLLVRRALAPLPARHLRRVSASALAYHRRAVEQP